MSESKNNNNSNLFFFAYFNATFLFIEIEYFRFG